MRFWEVRQTSEFYVPVNAKFHDYAKAREMFTEMLDNPNTITVMLIEYVAKEGGKFAWDVIATYEAAPEVSVKIRDGEE